ncbi:MAG: hypothetical protein JRK26_06075 [Deltaproteobacteria bacterium]|nr:hypothetical protein [Deltaproteobacteria bacterium]
MKRKMITMFLILLFIFGLSNLSFATEADFSLSDKEIIEKLARLEEGQKGLNKRIDDLSARLDYGQKALNKRIDDLSAKLDYHQKALNKRIDDLSAKLDYGQKALNKRIDDLRSELKGDIQGIRSELKGDIADLRNLSYIVLAGIIALIGFVIWDRRSALSPVITKTKELEARDDLTFRVLKEYARKEPKLAEVMKSLGLL